MTSSDHIYINTTLGCSSACSYCYLPTIGYQNNIAPSKSVSSQELIEYIEKNIPLNNNALISLGCYSEVWDNNNRKETIKLIKYFLKRGNQIQLSTKRRLLETELKEIVPLIQYYGQLIIFVSSATISMQPIIEKNTCPIKMRFTNFSVLNKLKIPAVLYIKPVLDGITIKDLDLYKKYIKKYKIKDVVVGSIFTTTTSDNPTMFPSPVKLYSNKNSDEDIIFKELSKITNVYKKVQRLWMYIKFIIKYTCTFFMSLYYFKYINYQIYQNLESNL